MGVLQLPLHPPLFTGFNGKITVCTTVSGDPHGCGVKVVKCTLRGRAGVLKRPFHPIMQWHNINDQIVIGPNTVEWMTKTAK